MATNAFFLGFPTALQLLEAYFADQQAAKDRKVSAASPDPNDNFLRSFILNRGWVDQEEAGYVPTYDEVRAMLLKLFWCIKSWLLM